MIDDRVRALMSASAWIAFASFALIGHAKATTSIPDAYYNGSAQLDSSADYSSQPGQYFGTGASIGPVSAASSLLGASVQTSVTAIPSIVTVPGYGNATLGYDIFISGPQPTVSVNLSWFESIAAASTAGATVQLSVVTDSTQGYSNLTTYFYHQALVYSGLTGDPGIVTRFNEQTDIDGSPVVSIEHDNAETDFSSQLSDKLILPTNILLTVGLVANVNAVGSGTANAFLDPYFMIDPTAANASDYIISESNGVSNLPSSVSVSEPGSLSLLLGFLVALIGLSFLHPSAAGTRR